MDVIFATVPTAMCVSPPICRRGFRFCAEPRYHFPGKSPVFSLQASISSLECSNQLFRQRHCSRISSLSVRCSASSGNVDYMEEPATSVRFQRSVTLPGCSSPLALLGTGYREKTFAIIGVKVYAAGFYVNESVLSGLSAWKGRSASEIQKDSSVFNSIFQAAGEKSLQIVLVRDVDGKTFWDALDEAITPRIKSPTPDDKSALSAFSSVFQGRPLKKGTLIFLTWTQPSKMLVSVSANGLPSHVDAEIESGNVASALFDVFFGDVPVSPTLKSSVSDQLCK
ncbi:PREDICTED: fatty-acid-binding protein 3, chloroplastic [Tarenaya hassleriana]|uniref:fatty-acid-binding protein 3, chloroplastic n=1 Tax=Tarenaya hassleriana TaxID=28532 RepID=UPI00053C9A74|nr:PREDICTED: fatty-acid-binding protein 3, chloroplastic [Tarenaya hassleriana]